MHFRIAALECEVLEGSTFLRNLIELEPGVVGNLVLSNLEGPHLDLSRSGLC